MTSPPTRATARPEHLAPVPLARAGGWLADLTGLAATRAGAAGDPDLTGLSLSTQRVEPGDLYAALPGQRSHGMDFAADALAAGAVAVLTDEAGLARAPREVLDAVPVLAVATPRAVLGGLAARLNGEPARAMTMIGVTGTQGKTTTTRLLEAGLQGSTGHAAVVGTVGTRVDGADVRTSLTTPEAPDLHGLFALMRERGVRTCAIEVSSHALVLGRVDGVLFDVAVFLNLGRDHLDFHADVEEYFAAKASLFTPERARRALVNADDEHGRRLVDLCRERGLPVRTFSTAGDADADWRATEVRLGPASSTFTVEGPGTRVEAVSPLPGDVNVANTLAALAAAAEAGLEVGPVAGALGRSGGVPGRFEQVGRGGPERRTVLVDYAHKPDAVAAALRTLRPLTQGRLAIVVGAGGDRDTGKRPVMGEVGARGADLLVVTDDNPRSEDPAAIRAEVLAGALGVPAGERAELREVGDRAAAIAEAVAWAQRGDVVLVAGKGHELGQLVAGVSTPFDDRAVLGDALADRAAGRVLAGARPGPSVADEVAGSGAAGGVTA